MNAESFRIGALEKLRNNYIEIGMDSQNRELLLEEIERLKNLRMSRGIHRGQPVFQDGDPQLQRVAAFLVGHTVKPK